MTINDAYKYSISELSGVEFIDSPELESEILLTRVLDLDKKEFLLEKDDTGISARDFSILRKFLKKRTAGKSIASITGKHFFYDEELFVDENVLIPRPETELLVEMALQTADKDRSIRILDVGTGSGAISVILSKHLENAKIDALDISSGALKIAGKNVSSKNITRINLIRSDFFKFIPTEKYDLIIANPPYIPESEVKELLHKKTVSDPEIALNGGKDGLDFYRHLKVFSEKFLNPGGFLIMEHGIGQRESVRLIFNGPLSQINCYDDLSGIDRMIKIKKLE